MLLSIFVFIFLSSSCACDDNIYLPEEVDMANIIIACINELEKRIKVLEDKLMVMKETNDIWSNNKTKIFPHS